METYREYVIRCKTCNEQIACFANEYESLLASGLTIEEALNELGITEYCSRIAMMNPTIVSFNMENREVIEGFKSVNAAVEADAQNESTARAIFSQCMMPAAIPAPIGTQPAITVMQPLARVQPNAPGIGIQAIGVQPTGVRPLTRGLQTITLIRPAIKPIQTPVVIPAPLPVEIPAPLPVEIPSPGRVQPIIPGIELGGEFEALGVGIPVKAPELENAFHEPMSVGLPTVNSDLTGPQPLVYVGAGKHVRVLNGRTYLAR